MCAQVRRVSVDEQPQDSLAVVVQTDRHSRLIVVLRYEAVSV